MNKATVRLLVIFFAVLVGSALLVYVVLERTSRSRTVADTTAAETSSPGSTPVIQPTRDREPNVLSQLFGIDDEPATASSGAADTVVAGRIFLRFLIGAFLAALLAFRWRRNFSITKRNPYVAQTQILLAVVAAAMMMVVGDSAARAFGIFAAASLVRFRTNVRDPKETTVLLICLGVGLACGVGRLDMALILTLFTLVALWILEHFESGQVFRTMEVSVGTRRVDDTLQGLKNIFARNSLTSELRQLDREDPEGENGKIVYELILGSAVDTDKLTEEILSEDGGNVSSLQWDQKKSTTYIYR
jgi:uncharacterized membrane protein YhiD involved in acid resistance